MNNNLNEKLRKLFAEESIVEEMRGLKDVKEIKEFLLAHGVELTDEEVTGFFREPMEKENAESLSEQELDQVSGGIIGTLTTILAASWSLAVYTYGSPEKAVQGIATYWYNKFK